MVLYIPWTYYINNTLITCSPPPPTEAAFHRTVHEFKKQGIEQQKEDGLEELTTANFPPHDPNKPFGKPSVRLPTYPVLLDLPCPHFPSHSALLTLQPHLFSPSSIPMSLNLTRIHKQAWICCTRRPGTSVTSASASWTAPARHAIISAPSNTTTTYATTSPP